MSRLGEPKYGYGDIVCFNYLVGKDELVLLEGKVAIVDAYGTLKQNEEPSYDILVSNFRNTGESVLVQHIRESNLCKKEESGGTNV